MTGLNWQIFILLILAVISGACASEFEPPSDEGGFLREMEYNFPGSNRENNLDTGKNVCFKLRSGMTQEEVIMEKFEHGMTITNAGIVIKLSTEYLCPVFNSKE